MKPREPEQPAPQPIDQTLLEAAAGILREGILCLDLEGRVIFSNLAAEQLLCGVLSNNATPVDSVRQLRVLRADGTKYAAANPLERALEGNAISQEEVLVDHPQQARHLLVFSQRVPQGTLVVLRDVTNERQLEAAQAQASSRLRLLLDSTDEGIYGLDGAGRCTFANPAACRMLGYELSELLGQNMHTLIHGRRKDGSVFPEDECRIFAAIRSGVGCRLDDEVLWTKAGVAFPAEYSSYPLNEYGQVTGAVVTFQDISQRLLAEDRRRQLALSQQARTTAEGNEATLRAVFANMVEVVLILDGLGRFVSIPATNSPLLARPAAELIGKNVFEIFSPEQARVFLATIRRALELGDSGELEYSLRIGEKELTFVGHGSRIAPDRVVWVAHDITERKAAELERIKLLQKAQEAQKEAEAASRTKDLFLAMLSHELRTPLASILLRADQLLRQLTEATPVRRAIEAIRKAAKDQARLVDDLLDVGRIANNKLPLNLEPVNMDSVVHSCVEALRPVAAEAGVRVGVFLLPLSRPVHADPHRLEQIVSNLLNNAIKFTLAGGSIEVQLEEDGAWAILRVRDSGIGIEPSELPRIFDRFYQVDRKLVQARGGLGLGLALVKDLAQLHGGTVEAHSGGRNRGATFTVRLPLMETTQPASGSPSSIPEPSAQPP